MSKTLTVTCSLLSISLWAGEIQPLWPEGRIPDFSTNQSVYAIGMHQARTPMPYLDWEKSPTNANGTCVILISGGAYENTCDGPAFRPFVKKFLERGVTCVWLWYRTPRPEGAAIYRSGWQDGQRAVRLVRAAAAARGFDPEKIGVLGCSAGSHLSVMLATSSQTPAYQPVDAADEVPCHIAFAIPYCPAYVLTDGLTGPNVRAGDSPEVKLNPCFRFDWKTCPMCLFHGGADPYSPNGSTQIYRQLRRMRIPAELHLDADRGHGVGPVAHFDRALEFLTQMGFLGKVPEQVQLMSRFADDAARGGYAHENLWPTNRMPDAQAHQCVPYLEWHFPKELKTKAIQIIYSGGSYCDNSPDSFEVAPARRYLNAKGMTVVTVKYRTPRPKGMLKHVTAWEDLQRAIRIVRSQAAAKGLDPDRIGIMGSSAGGHLTLMGATSSRHQAYWPIDEVDRLPCNVQWAVAIYPAYALTDGAEEPNAKGGNEDESRLVPEFAFDPDTCPVLFIHGDADGWAAMNSVKCWEQLRRMGIQGELHTLALRNHCFQYAAAPGTGSYTWLDRIWEFLAKKGFADAENDYPIVSAKLTEVKVTDGFWFDRLETNRLVTLSACLKKCNDTPRIANFTNAANRASGVFGGIPFDDSDVFKVMEGAAYVLAAHPDQKLEDYMTWLIGQVARAQEPDGYLYTARTLGFRDDMTGPTRWSNCPVSHELYNVGHMYEAAVAWKEATGRDDFLAVAVRNADLIDRTFGPGEGQLKDVPGHEEIELALVKLYRTTKDKRYLKLARHFVAQRGASGIDKREAAVFTQTGDLVYDQEMTMPGAYCQNHLPVCQQKSALGHAVRAGYLYCGMADVAALTGETGFQRATARIWENVVRAKLHLTGGIGARPHGEAFGADYELPNDGAYLETCAAIANALWNDRLFRASGEAKYMDVLERTIYNGFLSGVSLSGDRFFYPNPLASKGGYRRSKWFGCSCCPVNDVRFIPQVPSMAYATNGRGTVYWNLFMASKAAIAGVKLECVTDYPWDGKATLKVLSSHPSFTTLKVRIPGWAKGRPVPSDLYVQTVPASVMEVAVKVNGLPVNGVPGKDGYLAIGREWKAGDEVTLELPMPVKRIRAHAKVAADLGRLAVERGPIVYCAEGVDNDGKAFDAELPENATFEDDTIKIGDKSYPALKASNGLKLIPYCLWGNRSPGNELQVWMKAN